MFTSPSLNMQKPLTVFSSVQLLSCVRLFVTPWITECQASLSITNPRSSPKLISIELVMPSNHLTSSVIPFSSCPQSFPASGSLQMSQLFALDSSFCKSLHTNLHVCLFKEKRMSTNIHSPWILSQIQMWVRTWGNSHLPDPAARTLPPVFPALLWVRFLKGP